MYRSFIVLVSGCLLPLLQSCLTLASVGVNALTDARNAKIKSMYELENRATVNARMANYQSAKEDFASAIEIASALNSADHIVYTSTGLARMYVAQDSINDAQFAWSRAIAVNPKNENLQSGAKFLKRLDSLSRKNTPNNASTYYQRGIAKLSLQLYSKASQDFTEAIRLDGTFDSAYYGRANSISREISEMKEPIQLISSPSFTMALDSNKRNQYITVLLNDCKYLLSKNPNDVTALQYKAIANEESGAVSEAIDELRKVTEINPEISKNFAQKGALHFRLKQFAQAEIEYSKAIQKSSPLQTEYLITRSIIREKLNKFSEAKDDASQAIKDNPSSESYTQRAYVNLKLKEFSASKEDFIACAKWQQSKGESGENSSRAADAVQTIMDMNAEIGRNPKESSNYIRRGQNYYWLNHQTAAVEDLTQAIALNPQSAEAYNLRGLVKHSQEDYRAAINDFTESLTRQEDKFVYYHRYQSRELLGGQKELGCSDLKAAVKLGYKEIGDLVKMNCGM